MKNTRTIKRMVFVAILAVILMFIPFSQAHAASTTKAQQKISATEQKIKKKYKNVKFIVNDGSDEFWQKIENRKGKKFYYVEKVSGTVINNKKDGTAGWYYISYKHVKGVKKGSKVISYFVYSRTNNYCDDIIARYDVVIKK